MKKKIISRNVLAFENEILTTIYGRFQAAYHHSGSISAKMQIPARTNKPARCAPFAISGTCTHTQAILATRTLCSVPIARTPYTHTHEKQKSRVSRLHCFCGEPFDFFHIQ